MWVVCGPPRSGTTAMLEAVAAWTTLRVRWSLPVEWQSRTQTGRAESFLELPSYLVGQAGAGEVVKVLDPAVSFRPTRALLMIRDPVEVSRSARARLKQLISPGDVSARVEAFRSLGWDLDEVGFDELGDLPVLFARLADCGWPVVGPAQAMLTWGVR